MLIFLNPSSIFGSSDGFNGSQAILIVDSELKSKRLKQIVDLSVALTIVAVLTIFRSIPYIPIQLPALALFTFSLYLPPA